MRVEMERVKLAAKKEAADAARAKREASERDSAGAANAVEELARLNGELSNARAEVASAKKEVSDHRRKSEEALELAQARLSELESANRRIAELEGELDNLAGSDRGEADSLLQNELDEALALSRKQEKEIKTLKNERAQLMQANASEPQSVEPGPSPAQHEALQSEVVALREELELAKEKLLAAQTPIHSEGSTQADLQSEIAELRKELGNSNKQQAGSSAEYTSIADEMEMDKLREENGRLRGELRRATSSAAASSSDSVATSKSEKKMKKEIIKLKEANAKILDTAEKQFASLVELEKENTELRAEMEGLRERSSSGGPAADAGSFSDMKSSLAKAEMRLKAEKIRAEEAVAREAKLRNELAGMRLKTRESALNGDAGLVAHQSIKEGEVFDDVATLQYEIERLSNELLVAREESRSTDTFSADDMIRKYDELNRLAESGMQKDLEIEKLKMRVNTQDAELKTLRDEVTEEDLTFGMREYQEGDSDVAVAENEGLRSLNEELSKQLELYKKESEASKANLAEERTRADLEMKAFSVALRGVDDLRVAAEHMSRELHFIKRNGYVPPSGLTGEDSSEHVKNAMSAVESMARANQSIDHPSISGNGEVQQQGFNLWNAMNTVMSPAQLSLIHI